MTNEAAMDKDAGPKLRCYKYDEALDLTGNGIYNIGLLITMILLTVGMMMDMFGFSLVVSSSVCDLKFNDNQRNFLMCVPFIGPIVMSYIWGYVSDTAGRKISLVIAMFVSSVAATISAFSTNWIMLASLKFISTSFSSCAQSVTYALLSESCPQRVKAMYLFSMTSMLLFSPGIYFVIGYLILNLKFSLDIGILIFTPWRLLALVLASPLAIGCLLLLFFYESPKFLLNAGNESKALELLERIYYRNGGEKGTFSVTSLILNEEESARDKNVSFLKSLWVQTAPLFQPPLLLLTLQLYFLAAIIYSTNNSFIMWFPFVVKAFFQGSNSSGGEQGLCSAIIESQHSNKTTDSAVTCDFSIDLLTCVSCVIMSFLEAIVNLIIVKLSSRKKILMLSILIATFACCVGSVLVKNNLASFLLFIGILFVCLGIGVTFSYFIDLYPTSHRGMAVCLSVMVSRSSALAGINLVGAFVMTNCNATFYAWSIFILSGVVVAYFLPPDQSEKQLKLSKHKTHL